MKILHFTNTIGAKAFRGVTLTLLLLLGIATSQLMAQPSESYGDCSMVCAGDLIAPVDAKSCTTKITFHNLIPSPCFHDGYTIKILTLNNKEVVSGNNSVIISGPGKYIYKVGHEIKGEDVYCWGYLTLEDKKGPVKNLSYTPELNTKVCDTENSIDPSGVVDLKAEFVSCVVFEEHGKDGIEPWFDKLTVKDFKDCTGVKDVYQFDNKYDFCKDIILDEAMQIEMADMVTRIPIGWEPLTIYKRSWFAADEVGRLSDTCHQLVIILRPKARRIKIDKYTLAECGDDIDKVLKNGYPYFRDLNNDKDFLTCPSTAGKKIRLEPNTHYCKYSVSVHVGEKTPLCNTDGSKVFKLKSKWTVMDWCKEYSKPIRGNGGLDWFDDFGSILEVKDTKVPVAVGKADYHVSTALFDCSADVVVGPQKFDDCVGVESVETIAEYYINGDDPHVSQFERFTSPTNGITLKNVPLNVIVNITYVATDYCDYVGRAYNEIYIKDDRAPVCIANDELNVSMVRLSEDPDDVGARVYGEDLDDSSRDNCYPLILEVRRADQAADASNPESLWAEYVEFSKADLTDGGCRGEYKIELRVYEDYGYGKKGLYSTCWSTVILEDKNPPILKIDEVKEAKCTEPRPEFDELDIAGCYDGVDMKIDTLSNDDCNYYEVLRLQKTWKVYRLHDGVKQYKGTASQQIIIENVHDTKFTFPIDVKTDCSKEIIPDPATIDEIIDEEGCSNWLMEVVDTEYESNDPDACRKILRKYTFINWCTWDPSNTQIAAVRRPQDGVWSKDQQVVLHYRDSNYDKINDIDDADDGDLYDIEVSEFGYTSDGAWVQVDHADEVDSETVYSHNDDIRNKDVHSVDGYNYGYFSYIQVIKIQDGEKPVATDQKIKQACDPLNTDCDFPTTVEITLSGKDNCSDLYYSSYFQLNQEGPYVHDEYGILNGNVITGKYPVGTHNLLISTADACGNAVTDTLELIVNPECKKPTPICRATFTAAMLDGTVKIWASDIESGSSYDNCSEYDDLTFTIALVEDVNKDSIFDVQDIGDFVSAESSVTLTCDNIGKSILALWAIDEAGNTQFCLVPIFVVDNAGVCLSQEMRVAGKIVNESDEEIDQVTVNVDAPGRSLMSSIFSGFFDFISVPMQDNVTVRPEKDLGYLNGVSTSDLVLLQRHILGVKTLSSPYTIIAADANGDDNVDTRDMLHVSRLILGIYEEFPTNTSWRFVAKDHVFTNPTSPWGFPEVKVLNGNTDHSATDFIGVKIGDISGNALPSNLLGQNSPSTERTISIATENQELVPGEETTIKFTADAMNEVAGYQFTIQLEEGTVFNGLTFGKESDLTEANFGLTMIDKNLITVSWATSDAVNFRSGTELFGLKIVATSATTVQNTIRLNSAYTPAEAYDNDLDALDIKLNIKAVNNVFELYQNVPNPVSNETIIGFNLTEAGSASLRIMDVSGKVLKQVNGDFAKGYNQITLDRSELGSAGILYYQLEANQHSASMKMVIID